MIDTSRTINAQPTKDLFISMLVRDIQLVDAVVDLVDNSVDGARRLRGDGRYDGLWVHVQLSKESFKISDNCGGIPVDIARDYAFRFGRPQEAPSTPGSVGQFGVGMKRALFKLGKVFHIESVTEHARFAIDIDVETWKKLTEWEFAFSELEENESDATPEDRWGTTLTVESLHPTVVEDFELDNWKTRLLQQIQTAHMHSLDRGLAIMLNAVPVQIDALTLLQSPDLRAAYRERQDDGVSVRLFAGIADSSPSNAGWYIFCNGRAILDADQTNATGWGEDGEVTVPKYHNQFSRFRGYAFFSSEDPSLLPWNTTKTGIDLDSKLYRSVRLEMIEMMRPIITFLNKVDAELRLDEDQRVLTAAVKKATSTDLSTVTLSKAFVAPNPKPAKPPPATTRIAYDRPIGDVDRVKACLGVTSNKAVGESTFDYYLEMECQD